MKNTYILVFLLSFLLSFSQEEHTNTEDIAEIEKKSASGLINFVVNPNTQNYDITYHKLEFTVDPAIYFITGKVTTTFTALEAMNSVVFDLANELTVTSVKKNNINIPFVQNGNNELVITLPSLVNAGISQTVEITYSGAPPTSGFSAFAAQTHNGTPVLWTLSEPFGARDWWPCKQDLNDKITSVDIYITAPSQYVSASNGIEVNTPIIANGLKTTHFYHNYPIPAYLICIAVTNYTVFTQTAGTSPNSYPIVNYIYPETFIQPSVQNQLNQTPLILNYFSNLFEPYPFHNEKYGHAQFGWGGGMEHTTVSFMNNFSRGLIAHEAAHQWFGDKITCGSWRDIWLNEGFATYLSSLVIENFDGNDAFTANKSGMISNITSQNGGAVYLTEAEATDVNRIFSNRLSYNKGAMVLNMLRLKLGDVAFFQALKNYLADSNLAFKYAVTSDLKSHLEAVYGSSLTEFFNDWVFNQGFPSYNVTAQNWGIGQVKVTISQSQSHPSVSFFEMPVPIRLTGNSGQVQDIVVQNTANNQEFIIAVPFTVNGIQFDPNKNIISKNNTASLRNEQFELENRIFIYPNPTSTEINVQTTQDIIIENITIFNSLGQELSKNQSSRIIVSQLSTGIYYLHINTSKGVTIRKFIKE